MRRLLIALCLVAAGCSKIRIGESCETPSVTSDCEEGAVCANSSTGNTCRKLCTDDSQCAANENCSGVSGSNLKVCQPD